ncbi:unnamed protein product [Cyprideis torosa]|uniref:Uncharacterized protein n=1 Tax=Cyprideis torosa TaxID=163714 RepID=A0A7R8WD26_9CRUS|nr:unnamed protein product [Cyprideis torosa]CAG0892681.1 unnamed protein product [Cyprideis torosa]
MVVQTVKLVHTPSLHSMGRPPSSYEADSAPPPMSTHHNPPPKLTPVSGVLTNKGELESRTRRRGERGRDDPGTRRENGPDVNGNGDYPNSRHEIVPSWYQIPVPARYTALQFTKEGGGGQNFTTTSTRSNSLSQAA